MLRDRNPSGMWLRQKKWTAKNLDVQVELALKLELETHTSLQHT